MRQPLLARTALAKPSGPSLRRMLRQPLVQGTETSMFFPGLAGSIKEGNSNSFFNRGSPYSLVVRFRVIRFVL